MSAHVFRFGDCLEHASIQTSSAEVAHSGGAATTVVAGPLVAVIDGGGARGNCTVGGPDGGVAYASDVVFVGALIHWVFSATARFGSFKDILEYDDPPPFAYFLCLLPFALSMGSTLESRGGGKHAHINSYVDVFSKSLSPHLHLSLPSLLSLYRFVTPRRYLLELTGRFLLVEWVAEGDPAIAVARHTDQNPQVQAEAYSTANFEAALGRLVASGVVSAVRERVAVDGPTRVLYVVEKPRTLR